MLLPLVAVACLPPEGEGVAAEISGIDPAVAMYALVISSIVTFIVGFLFLLKRRGSLIFAAMNTIVFFIALVAIVSCIALYIYEHPHHHCPFCILKQGHDFIGYYLYVTLFMALALGLGAGAITFFSKNTSLQVIAIDHSRRYITASLSLLLCFYFVAGYAVATSNLSMAEVWW